MRNHIRAILLFAIPTTFCGCSKRDTFEDVFGIPRPAFLKNVGQELLSESDSIRSYSYVGKFPGDSSQFEALCSLLDLRQADRPLMTSSSVNEASWWDLSPQLELTEYKKTFCKGIPDDFSTGVPPMGVLARLSNGYIYLNKIGETDMWGDSRIGREACSVSTVAAKLWDKPGRLIRLALNEVSPRA